MRWLLWVVFTYVAVIVVLVVAVSCLARGRGRLEYTLTSPDAFYWLQGRRDFYLPLRLNGPGRAPGEVRVLDRHWRVIDEVRLEDVESVQDVRWNKFEVDFSYERGGRTYRTSLDLPQ